MQEITEFYGWIEPLKNNKIVFGMPRFFRSPQFFKGIQKVFKDSFKWKNSVEKKTIRSFAKSITNHVNCDFNIDHILKSDHKHNHDNDFCHNLAD